MSKGRTRAYFLGANTPQGFSSLYDQFADSTRGDFLYVIKGGPGSGKSSFMRFLGAAAEDAGLDVEYIRCSGDPDSLDGLYIPARGVAYADGTVPHVLEPPFCGAGGAYIDLGKYTDSAAMRPLLHEVSSLNRRYKDCYRRAYALLSGLPALDGGTDGLCTPEDIEGVRRRARSAANREMRKRGGTESETRRFLSAFSCKGRVVCTDTLSALCDRVYLLDRGLGLSDVYLREIALCAEKRGLARICCVDPLAPDTLEAVLLPELSLGYAAGELPDGLKSTAVRHIRLDRIPDGKRLDAARPQLKSLRKLRTQLLAEAQRELERAKALHDELEALYNPHVDFSGVSDEAQRHVDALLRRPEKG